MLERRRIGILEALVIVVIVVKNKVYLHFALRSLIFYIFIITLRIYFVKS